MRTFAGKVYLSMRYHIIWGLKSLVAVCLVVRAHCSEAQLEIELLWRAIGEPYTALNLPLLLLRRHDASVSLDQYRHHSV